MRSKVLFTIAAFVFASALIMGQAAAPQGQAPAQSAAGGRGAPQGPVVCQGTPEFAAQQAQAAAGRAQGGGGGGQGAGRAGAGAPGAAGAVAGRGPGAAPAGPRQVTITAIAGVIAANAKWTAVWSGPGNNSDGAVALPDGSLLIAQEDTSTVTKLDAKTDKATIYIADTHGAGALSIDHQGRIWAVQRITNAQNAPNPAPTAGIAILNPASERKVANTFSDGTPWLGRPNDLAADSKGGAYFTQGCVYYASPAGTIMLVGKNLRTNGIVFSPDDKTLYVTNQTTIAAMDVQPDGSLSAPREFAMLEAMGADGLAVDSTGRLYVSGGTDIKVVSPQGRNLGLIPTPTGTISVAIGGPDHKMLYIVANGAVDEFGTPVTGANNPAFNAWRTIYKIPILAEGPKNRGK